MTSDVFQRLLRLIASDTVQTLGQLAAELDVDQRLLEQMLNDLERAGYLRLLQGCGERRCSGCDLRGLCRVIHGGRRTWVATDKGLRVARTP